jgi:hypothetical protein
MAEIEVSPKGQGKFRVEVREGGGATVHDVTANDAEVRRYAGDVPAERLIEESFRFLLEREPKESILRSFELPVIEHYFPDYPKEIRDRLE